MLRDSGFADILKLSKEILYGQTATRQRTVLVVTENTNQRMF